MPSVPPTLLLVLIALGTSPVLGQGLPTSGQHAPPARLRPLSVPADVQAGQLLEVAGPRGLLRGTIQGASLTGGVALDFGALPGLERSATGGSLTLRVPPRESGPLQLTFLRRGLPGSPPVRETHTVTVTPPNLYDGVRLDGVHDPFEAGLIAGHSVQQSAQVTMVDASTSQPVGTASVDYEVATDSQNIYLRVRFEDATEDRQFDLNVDAEPQRFDLLSLRFDDGANGTYDPTDDERIVLPYLTGSGYIDATADPAANNDLTVDGAGRMAWDSGAWTAEFLFPRTPDATGQDPDLSIGAQVPFQLFIADGIGPQGTAPRIGSLFPGVTGSTAAWQPLPLPAPLPASYAPVYTPTQGHLMVISEHEDPKGELYEVDLASSTLQRRTFNNRYEDWVSVAPDGSFATYGSSPDRLDFAHYEIYKWEAISGLELPLTLDNLLDGHPAVSPDGKEIAWARFLSGPADIFIMQSDGTAPGAFTTDPAEENDPEWTKDGGFVIKTSVFTGSEQLALFDGAGNLKLRLTQNPYSDHDPFVTADNQWALFERFLGTGPWAADANLTQSTSWPIVAVRLDGSVERTLVEDGLVNWLPVSGPLGPDEDIIVYFRTTAFNGLELRMIDRFGVDHGRLLPAQSHIRYMDWK